MCNDTAKLEDPETLLKDVSLFKIWCRLNFRGRKGIRTSKWSIATIMVCGLLASLYVYQGNPTELPLQIRFIALHGLKLATGVLSFLLAGFVFFLSTSHTNLLHAMYRTKEDKTGLDYLRYNTFSLMALFAEFVVGALAFAIVVVFGQTNGAISYLLNFAGIAVRDGVIKIAFVLFTLIFVLLVLRLRTFIVNYYHFSMTALVVAFDEIEEAENGSEEDK